MPNAILQIGPNSGYKSKMKPIDHIPTSKIKRASELAKTGVKVGRNYLKYYGEKLVNPDLDKSKLNSANAEDIYESLKNLKGSALKAAQMLSMEKNTLPGEFIEKFSLAQFSVPPLSAPLVNKTFRKYLNKNPDELFDRFNAEAVSAASIGQVHEAWLDDKKLAVKIQYPGVAESISSDLAMVKPVALKLFQLSAADVDHYFKEVEGKLLEETDYELELKQGQEIAQRCGHLPNLRFPEYYPDYSSSRILTMDWMQGQHLSEYVKSHPSQEQRDALGQTLWDFYMYQMHGLRKLHADPHPGNFMVTAANELVVIDFGCMKDVPEHFYTPCFELLQAANIEDRDVLSQKLAELEIFKPTDKPEDIEYLLDISQEMVRLVTQPFRASHFDFGEKTYFQHINTLSEKFARDQRLRKLSGGRGSQHFLYVNRTFFGLYLLLHDLEAEIDIEQDIAVFLAKNAPSPTANP